MCPNGIMGSEFSALDAELDALAGGPPVDALLLAQSYAGTSFAIADVDAQLHELDADRKLESRAPSAPPLPRFRRSSTPPSLRAPASEEIVLPEPVRDEPRTRDGSGELALPGKAGASRSGSYSLEAVNRKGSSRDITLDAYDEELMEADASMFELTGDPGTEKRPSLFDVKPSDNAEAQREADAAFAELFADASRKSSLPSPRSSSLPGPRSSQVPEQYNDDTETFDTSALVRVEQAGLSADADDLGIDIMAEELDSAEFEIVLDNDEPAEPAAATAAPREERTEPEKRPSFLGRLFGRKEE